MELKDFQKESLVKLTTLRLSVGTESGDVKEEQ